MVHVATLQSVGQPCSHAWIDDVIANIVDMAATGAAKENIHVWPRHKILLVGQLYFSIVDALQLVIVEMASNPVHDDDTRVILRYAVVACVLRHFSVDLDHQAFQRVANPTLLLRMVFVHVGLEAVRQTETRMAATCLSSVQHL